MQGPSKNMYSVTPPLPFDFKNPIPETKIREIHNCWLARAALDSESVFECDIWGTFAALPYQERAYFGKNGPDAFKPLDSRSRLHTPPQYVIVPLIQQLQTQLEEHERRSITCTVKHEGVHVHVVYHSRDNIKIYTKNDHDALVFCAFKEQLQTELRNLWDAALENNSTITALRGEFVFEPYSFEDQNAYQRLRKVVAEKQANKLYIFDCKMDDPDLPQHERLRLLSEIITREPTYGVLRVSDYRYLHKWNYDDEQNVNDFMKWCTSNIALNEGIIACCEDPSSKRSFKLKLKYWVYYDLSKHTELRYQYCSFNSDTKLHNTRFLELQEGVLKNPGMYSLLSFHDANVIRAQPGAPLSEADATRYNEMHQIIHDEQNRRNHLSCFKKS